MSVIGKTKLWKRVRSFYQNSGRFVVSFFLCFIILLLGLGAYYQRHMREMLVYKDSLGKVAAVIEDQSLTLRQLAFYVAYEEMKVDMQARAYDDEDTGKYWNLKADHSFVRDEARNAAMQMALHDEIFYQMAMEEGVILPQEEQESLENSQRDFWDDLSDYGGAEKLGVTREEIDNTIEHIAYAQYYQMVYAMMQGADYEDYDFSGAAFQELLDEYDYEVKEKVWKRVDFGNVILEH